MRNLDLKREYNRQYNAINKLKISVQKREYYSKNQEKILSRSSVRNTKRKIKVIQHYGGVCSCCGEYRIEFLCLDHKYGGGNKHREDIGSGTPMYKWVINNNFPPLFRVLCHNCNMALGSYGYCPHTEEK